MKSTHVKKETNKEKINFPYLAMAENGAIFLVLEHMDDFKFKGICVQSSAGNFLGQLGSSFALDLINPLPKGEQIILEN